jgi:hypothetical protein
MLISDIAALYGLSRQWLNKLVERGEIPGVRRKPNGRLEIFDEKTVVNAASFEYQVRRERTLRAAYWDRPETALPAIAAMPPGKVKKILSLMVRRDMLKKAFEERDAAKAAAIFPGDPVMRKIGAAATFARWGRTFSSRLARFVCVDWYYNPGEHIVDALRYLSRVGMASVGKGNRHGSLARIAKSFGLSRQALSQAWRRYRLKLGIPALYTGRN